MNNFYTRKASQGKWLLDYRECPWDHGLACYYGSQDSNHKHWPVDMVWSTNIKQVKNKIKNKQVSQYLVQNRQRPKHVLWITFWIGEDLSTKILGYCLPYSHRFGRVPILLSWLKRSKLLISSNFKNFEIIHIKIIYSLFKFVFFLLKKQCKG